jgi:hypothetical protein
MNNAVSIDNKLLRRQGARFAVLSAIVGTVLFVVIDTFPLIVDDLSAFSIGLVIVLAVFASLLSLPFSIIGGYALGWLLENKQWYKQGNIRVIASGVIIAAITLIVIFAIGSSLQLCLLSHGMCVYDFATFLRQTVINSFSSGSLTDVGRLFVSRFIKTLLIAMVCGGVTAWRLSQLAQDKPA